MMSNMRIPGIGDRCYQPASDAQPRSAIPGIEAVEQECYNEDNMDTYAAAFADVNGDGFVDLYIGNAVSDSDMGAVFSGADDELLLNQGDGTFVQSRATMMIRSGSTSVSAQGAPSDTRQTKAVAWGDYDADGFVDLGKKNESVVLVLKHPLAQHLRRQSPYGIGVTLKS